MSQQNIEKDHSHDAWYVMWHLKPSQIEAMLQKDSAGLFTKPGEKPLPSYHYYVPFLYMPVLRKEKTGKKKGQETEVVTDKPYNPQDDENALRHDLHNFVFIQASEERVRAIVSSDWNSKAHTRLNYYRDTNHKEVKIPDAEVRMLMDTIQSHHLQFYIDQPLGEFTVGDKVVLQMQPWTGKPGIVKKVAIKHGQLCMTISMNILGRTKSINFTDVRVGDVLFEDAEQGRMLTDNPITNYEEEIIDLLSHRFGNRYTDDVAKADQQRLRRLAAYDRIYVDDDAELARFTALKLICAYLRNDKKHRDHYQQKVLALLSSSPSPFSPAAVPSLFREVSETAGPNPSALSPQTDAEAYLMTALFITTRQAPLRVAVKAYRNSHPTCLPVLHRFHAILKDLKAKR